MLRFTGVPALWIALTASRNQGTTACGAAHTLRRSAIRRLAIAVLLCVTWPGVSFGEGTVPKTDGWLYAYGGPGGVIGGWWPGPGQACNEFVSTLPTSGNNGLCSAKIVNTVDYCTGAPWQTGSERVIATYTYTEIYAGGCGGVSTSYGEYVRTIYSQNSSPACPANSADDPKNTSQCICNVDHLPTILDSNPACVPV